MPGNPARGMLGDYLRAVQLKQQHEQFQQQHDLAQQQLDLAAKIHQRELDRMQQEFELNKTKTAQTLQQHLIDQLAQGIRRPPENAQPTGVDVQYGQPSQSNLPPELSSILPQAQGITSTGSQFQLGENDLGGLAGSLSPADRTINFRSPEEAARQAAAAAGQKTSAEETGRLPGQLAIEQTRANARETTARIAAEQRAQAAEDRNALQRYQFEHINATQQYKVDHPFGTGELGDTGALADAANMGSVGTGDLASPSSKMGLAQREILARQNKVEFGSKKGAALDSLSDLDGLVTDMKDAANALPDSGNPTLDAAQAATNALKTKLTPWQTDLENKMNAVKAKAPQTLRGLQGVTRINLPEISTQVGNTVSARMTKKEALGNIDRFQRDIYTKAYSDLMGGVSNPGQRVAILAQHGGLQKWRGVNISIPPARNPQTGQIVDRVPVIQNFDGHDHLWNPSKGTYDDIEGYK